MPEETNARGVREIERLTERERVRERKRERQRERDVERYRERERWRHSERERDSNHIFSPAKFVSAYRETSCLPLFVAFVDVIFP